MDGRYRKEGAEYEEDLCEVTKEQARRQGEGEALWLQVGGRGLSDRKEGLGRCLVGSWGAGSVKSMGGPFMLLEFEDENEAERTLKRGTRRFNDKVLHLERWSVEAGCSKVGSLVENVWLWWERLPWFSKVLPMKKMTGGEKEKAREEREVGSRAENRSSKRTESWRVAEDVGADSARKMEGKKSLLKMGSLLQMQLFQSEGSQDQLDWASKVKKKPNGPWDCWEEGSLVEVQGGPTVLAI
ncbi:hypothetical protein CK203_013625 [Vitis vinifera]|uniref:DUF4283 domain-containing protein n=1 Tax=Vitis vinifera TaxID=29760 RepID=A0A438J963_VITVI|nr:hypothetical protein CK203_013625 [Vitis vinifera]